MSQRDGTAFARGRDPGEVVRAGMRELAGSHLYRQNAFRLTGLPATVDRTGARRRQQQLVAALKLGADVDELGSSRDPDAVRAAFDVLLGDPRRRLVHEVFAAWGEPDGCECPALVHQQHDTAVTAHAEAIDIDPDELLAATMAGELPAAWDLAAGSWSRTVRSASFWRHLRHRVERLDDRQLDVSAVDVLKGELPKLLVKPLLALAASARYPAPLRKGIDDWPVSRADADWRLEEAAEPLYEELESLVGDLHARVDSDDPDEVVAMVREAVNPALARLEGLIPRDGSRRTAVAVQPHGGRAEQLRLSPLPRRRQVRQHGPGVVVAGRRAGHRPDDRGDDRHQPPRDAEGGARAQRRPGVGAQAATAQGQVGCRAVSAADPRRHVRRRSARCGPADACRPGRRRDRGYLRPA